MFSKSLKAILLLLLIFIFAIFCYFFLGPSKPAEKITWGINFSQKHAQNLGLDWKETYLALLGDLGVKNLKIATYWDLIEPKEGEYNFNDLDWQIKEAEKREAKIILVIGMKTPRWPECHEPSWAQIQNPKSKIQNLLEYIEKIIERYKTSPAVWAWQVENEPFFSFGECPKLDKELLKREIDLVKSLDSRPVIISDTGEFSLWLGAAKLADIVGVTLYRQAWFKEINSYISYPFPAIFYQRRAELVRGIFNKKTICVELQAEPWGQKLLYDLSLAEQEKTMNLEKFQKNIEFARKTGFDTFYLWGAEWWYWLKDKQNRPEIWNEVKSQIRHTT